MNDNAPGRIVFDVTNARGFATALYYKAGPGGEWDVEAKECIKLLGGGDGLSDSDEGVAKGADGNFATVGTSGHEYYGKDVSRYQEQNLPELAKYVSDTIKSLNEAAKGTAVMSEEFQGQDANNGEAVEDVYTGFGEAAPHGLYPGQ